MCPILENVTSFLASTEGLEKKAMQDALGFREQEAAKAARVGGRKVHDLFQATAAGGYMVFHPDTTFCHLPDKMVGSANFMCR